MAGPVGCASQPFRGPLCLWGGSGRSPYVFPLVFFPTPRQNEQGPQPSRSHAMFDRSLSRRDMIRTGAAAVAAATLPNWLSAKDVDPFGGFTVAIQSYTFRKFNLEKAVSKIASLGVKNAEFFRDHIPVESKPEQIKSVLKLCKDNGVTPVAFVVEPFSKNHDENKRRFEFGAALGVKSLSADPTPDAFDSLDKLCDEYKIAIAIHPHGPSGGKNRHRWWSAEVILAAV